MSVFHLTIASPDGELFDGQVSQMILRGSEGDLAVMAQHVPFVTSVKPCDCRIELEDGTERIGRLSGGLLTVSGEKVTLLSGSFHW